MAWVFQTPRPKGLSKKLLDQKNPKGFFGKKETAKKNKYNNFFCGKTAFGGEQQLRGCWKEWLDKNPCLTLSCQKNQRFF